MSNIFATQLLEEAMANVNVPLVVALMAIGFIIKHFKVFDKVENVLIPPVLLVFSIVVLAFENGLNVDTIIPTIISGIVNAAVAIGLHQQGKNIFTMTVVPSISEMINNLFKKDEEVVEEEPAVDEVVSEEE